MEKVILQYNTLCVFQRGIYVWIWASLYNAHQLTKNEAAPNQIVERKNFSCNQFGCQCLAGWKSKEKKRDFNLDVFLHSVSNFHRHTKKGRESLLPSPTQHIFAVQPQLYHLHFEVFFAFSDFDGWVKARKSTRKWCWFDFNTNYLTLNIPAYSVIV